MMRIEMIGLAAAAIASITSAIGAPAGEQIADPDNDKRPTIEMTPHAYSYSGEDLTDEDTDHQNPDHIDVEDLQKRHANKRMCKAIQVSTPWGNADLDFCGRVGDMDPKWPHAYGADCFKPILLAPGHYLRNLQTGELVYKKVCRD